MPALTFCFLLVDDEKSIALYDKYCENEDLNGFVLDFLERHLPLYTCNACALGDQNNRNLTRMQELGLAFHWHMSL